MKNSIRLAPALMLLASPALAHHPLAGAPMETFTHGVLSGVGHPVLGFDHLFFILIVGVAATFTGGTARAMGSYIAMMLIGCLLMNFGVGLPAKEVVIGISLLVVGGMVTSGKTPSLLVAMVLFAGFGLFHGSAFGDAIANQEAALGSPVLIGYLIGLGITQMGIAMAACYGVKHIWKAVEATAVPVRLAGAVVAGVGLFLTLENFEGMAFGIL